MARLAKVTFAVFSAILVTTCHSASDDCKTTFVKSTWVQKYICKSMCGKVCVEKVHLEKVLGRKSTFGKSTCENQNNFPQRSSYTSCLRILCLLNQFFILHSCELLLNKGSERSFIRTNLGFCLSVNKELPL